MESIRITKENFEKEVLSSDQPVLVDFWAAWCGPCRMQGPIVEEMAGESKTYKVGKIDVDAERELAEKYAITSIPTLIVFKNGEVSAKAVGVQSKEQLKALLA